MFIQFQIANYMYWLLINMITFPKDTSSTFTNHL